MGATGAVSRTIRKARELTKGKRKVRSQLRKIEAMLKSSDSGHDQPTLDAGSFSATPLDYPHTGPLVLRTSIQESRLPESA